MPFSTVSEAQLVEKTERTALMIRFRLLVSCIARVQVVPAGSLILALGIVPLRLIPFSLGFLNFLRRHFLRRRKERTTVS